MKTTRKDQPKITGVIIVTHTDYGERLLAAAQLILGQQSGCRSIPVDVSSNVEETVRTIKTAIQETDTGNGVLILTDMFGGTPTNLSLSLLGAAHIEVITGVNLPMLLKVLGSRAMPPADLAREAKKAGVQGIVVAGEVLRQKVADG